MRVLKIIKKNLFNKFFKIVINFILLKLIIYILFFINHKNFLLYYTVKIVILNSDNLYRIYLR